MLAVEDVRIAFDGSAALDGATLTVRRAETVAVLGPSGCGKTTLLRAVAGLQPIGSGRIALDGEDLGATPPHARGIGFMFQDNVLFPHRDVAGNVAFGLRMRGLRRPEISNRVRELLELVGLPGTESRNVRTLSGGEQQRIALARALAPEPRVLLLDEPLGSLDAPLRERLVDDLRMLFQRLRLTVVYVTHDVGEAFALGNQVAVMRAGRVVQTGPPDEVWLAPADDWVARFLGMRNLLDAGDRCTLVRPDAVRIGEGDNAEVLTVQRRGAAVRVVLQLADGVAIETTVVDRRPPQPGDRVGVSIDPTGVVELPRHEPEPSGARTNGCD